jgi:hypothetical protein
MVDTWLSLRLRVFGWRIDLRLSITRCWEAAGAAPTVPARPSLIPLFRADYKRDSPLRGLLAPFRI